MNGSKRGLQAVILVAAISGTAAITWHFARQDLRAYELDDTLRPIAALIDENLKTLDSLKKDGISESEILANYLQQIRKDGVPKNSGFKQRIDSLVNNNSAIVTLISKYEPHAHTPEFRAAADKFRDYAAAYRDRWQSVFEIFMAGGNLPAESKPFPAELADVVSREISAE
jgi:secreted Zn-dependent insulinase-like peptidase